MISSTKSVVTSSSDCRFRIKLLRAIDPGRAQQFSRTRPGRLVKGNDARALAVTGIEPMLSRGKHMHGWVRADAGVYGNDDMRRKLIAAAFQ